MTLPDKNLLGNEVSPYLLQHKDNPVHWRAWCPEALQEARELNKPVLLSVGYAACHWCHVMAHESFEDAKIADVMNRLFVNIKVDREERPEIDQIYMAALGAMGEQGGWPLTMFLTPDGRPFWGGTYFPPEPRYGRPGFLQVLTTVADAFNEKVQAVADNANSLLAHLSDRLSPTAAETEPEFEALENLAGQISRIIDPVNGGLTGRQKFPSAPFMETLWLSAIASENEEHQNAFIHSLEQMLYGGIYDHVGGGLCRYATDPGWLVPHFEKMLYDNAAMIRHCVWAHSRTGNDLFRKRIELTVQWLIREMLLPEGAFAASLDADSEGEEGKYYVWSKAEIDAILGSKANEFCKAYGVSPNGNWEGKNILHLRHSGAGVQLSEGGFADARNQLLNARLKRIPPARDEKIIIDWNAMMIRALCEAGRYLGEPGWIKLAQNAFDFIRSSAINDRLPHTITQSRKRFPGILGDHAAMILAAIALFEATGNRDFTEQAAKWFDVIERWYGDGRGGHYLTASDAQDIPLRIRGDNDEAVMSSTALAIEALHRLALATGRADLHDRAREITSTAFGRAQGMAFGNAGIIFAASLTLQPLKLVLGMRNSQSLVSETNRVPDPRRIDIRVTSVSPDRDTCLPDGSMIDPDKPGAYLCSGPVCYPPITDAAELRRKLLRPFH